MPIFEQQILFACNTENNESVMTSQRAQKQNASETDDCDIYSIYYDVIPMKALMRFEGDLDAVRRLSMM